MAGALLATDKAYFAELLYFDAVRGQHATGVAQVRGQFQEVDVFKLATTSSKFLEVAGGILDEFVRNTVVIGHNRHATKGSSSDPKGAHPFQKGHITLVHNGSLTYHGNLTTETYTVDSEAIAQAIRNEGIEAVAPKLRGAYALVWVDSELNTLNFLRNDQRPMAIAYSKSGNKMWWASEKDMLNLTLNRDTYTRSPVAHQGIFKLPVGLWLQIPITTGGIDLANKRETQLDLGGTTYGYVPKRIVTSTLSKSTTSTSTGTISRARLQQESHSTIDGEPVTDYYFGNTREAANIKLSEKIIEERGRVSNIVRCFIETLDTIPSALDLESRVGFFVTDWVGYSAQDGGVGCMNGQMMEYPYGNIKIHSVSKVEFDNFNNKYHGMLSSYLAGFDTTKALYTSGHMALSQLENVELMLKKEQIRAANIQDYDWDVRKIPESSKAHSTYKTIVLEQQEEDNDEAVDGILTLNDGSKINIGGSAVFIGNNIGIPRDHRYLVDCITWDIDKECFNVTVMVNVDEFHSHNESMWKLGLEKEPLLLDHDGVPITREKWKAATKEGCCSCLEIPQVGDELHWISTSVFVCEPCNFEIANAGYT